MIHVGRVHGSSFPPQAPVTGAGLSAGRQKPCLRLWWLCQHVASVLQASAASQLPPPTRLGEDELLLLAFRVRILQLFDRMRGCLNFPSSEQWNKMQPPTYLMTQAVKILELCMAADISDELRSSIRAIVNAQQL